MIKTAVILAAGRGSRLDPGYNDTTFAKPLVKVAGQTLLGRSVDACRQAGAEKIYVVTGFRAKLIDAEVDRLTRGDVETVYNPAWELANGVSLLACHNVVDTDFALLMADHVFDPSIMNDLMDLSPPAGSVTLAVDRKIDSVAELHEANKVQVKEGRIVAIGKELSDYECIDIGLFVCTTAMFEALAAIKAERGDCSITEGVRAVAARGAFLPFDIGPRWWLNINTAVTLARAEEILGQAGS